MITGLARSGTTFLTQSLNHHPEVACFPDPLNEFFRAFHHFAYFHELGIVKDAFYPMDNFFFSGHPAVRKFLETTDLRHEIPAHQRQSILERVAKRGGRYCPVLKQGLSECRACSFDALFLELMSILLTSWEKKNARFVGLKEAWCEHMILPLAKTFPNMKFIHILRDPRAIISSNLHSKSPYPLIFNVRDWRKSVYWSWRLRRPAERELRDRFLSLKYEDLIEQPSAEFRRITDYLGLPYSDEIFKKEFPVANTSYADLAGINTISSVFVNQWKERLPLEKQKCIEYFCWPELRKLCYPTGKSPGVGIGLSYLGGKGEISYSETAAWCRKILPSKFVYATFWKLGQFLLESARLFFFGTKLCWGRMIDGFFYEKGYWDYLVGSKGDRSA